MARSLTRHITPKSVMERHGPDIPGRDRFDSDFGELIDVVTLIHRRRPASVSVAERHAGKRLKGGDKNGRILCRHIYKPE